MNAGTHQLATRLGLVARPLLFGLAISACLAFSPTNALASGSITEFSSGLSANNLPRDITAGPDGNLWFTNPAGEPGTPSIGRITPSGTITEYSTGLQAHSSPGTIVAGPDGNLWFTDPGEESGTPSIGRITPTGTITEFHSGLNQEAHAINLQGPNDIVAGPDGNLWFTDSGGFQSVNKPDIGKITPSGTITEYELPGACNEPGQIIVGPDNNLWVAESGKGPFCGAIARVTTSGTITEFSSTFNEAVGWPGSIVSGPDGNLWFTGTHAIGRITTAGVITAFSSGLQSEPFLAGIVVGPDGNLWFSDSEHIGKPSDIGRITTGGTITEFPVGGASHHFAGSLLAGPDGNLWFTDANRGEGGSSAIGRITTSGQVTLFSDGLKERGEPAALVVGPGGSDLWFSDREALAGAVAIGKLAPVSSGTTPNPALTISTQGSGSVSSAPGGISCGATCEAKFASGGLVTLTATPASGYTFAGWNADRESCEFYCSLVAEHEGEQCSGTAACNLTIHGDTSISAVFVPTDSGDSGSPGGGGGGPPTTTPSPPAPTPKTPKKNLKCHKGFKKVTAHGKARCVKIKARHKHRH